MLAGLILTVFGQQEGLPPIMQSARMTVGSLNMNLMAKNAQGATQDAQKIQMLYTQAGDIFKALKAQDAVDFAKMQVDDAAAVVQAVKANDFDAATGRAKSIQARCGMCHMAHREQLPDKTFRFKP